MAVLSALLCFIVMFTKLTKLCCFKYDNPAVFVLPKISLTDN